MSLPTYEALWASQVAPEMNEEAQRIYWAVHPNISEAIFILDDIKDPSGSRQPAYQQEALDGHICGHPILRLSLYETPVSAVTVKVETLQAWCDSWWGLHAYFDGDDTDGPCRCCNRLPPDSDQQLTVRATSGHVTIGDYIAAVHSWLVSLRQDLLWAMSPNPDSPLPEDAKLMVVLIEPDFLFIEEPEYWLSSHRSYVRTRQERSREG